MRYLFVPSSSAKRGDVQLKLTPPCDQLNKHTSARTNAHYKHYHNVTLCLFQPSKLFSQLWTQIKIHLPIKYLMLPRVSSHTHPHETKTEAFFYVHDYEFSTAISWKGVAGVKPGVGVSSHICLDSVRTLPHWVWSLQLPTIQHLELPWPGWLRTSINMNSQPFTH